MHALSEARYFGDSNPVALERTACEFYPHTLAPIPEIKAVSYAGKTFGRCSISLFSKSWQFVLSELLPSSPAGSPLNLTDQKYV